MTDFQTAVNVYNALGIPGELAFDGPIRAGSYNLYSEGVPNVVGYAYTIVSGINPEPSGAAGNAGTAKVGGTGIFAGILINPKEYALRGVTGNPLGASLVLPDYAIGDLLTMGEVFVNLPGGADVGDLVTYDPLTGALNSVTPEVEFVGDSSTTTLTVDSISKGAIYVGMLVTGANTLPGTYVTAFGTGLGGTGTYTINVSQSITSNSDLKGSSAPAPAFAATASIAPGSTPATDPSVMTVSAVGSGTLRIGQQVFGTGIPANTTIVSFGTGVGGTGTYNISAVNLTLGSRAVTGPVNLFVPNAVVTRYDANSTGGVAAIKLTN